MNYTSLLKNVKVALNIMYFITSESDKSVISDTVYEPSKCGSFRILTHNVTIDRDFTKGCEIKVEIEENTIRFYKTIFNSDNMAIRYQYLFDVDCTRKSCAEIVAHVLHTMTIIVEHYCER